jgi:hypothetical protein
MKMMGIAVAGILVAGGTGSIAQTQSGAPLPPPPPKTWADSVTVKGDIRYRNETINDDSKLNASGEEFTRIRDRIRARLGAEAKCSGNLKAGIEISTGQSDPVSGNQTIGDGFVKKDFKLNLAYADYDFFPDSAKSLRVVAGKMKNPFITMNDDLVWDGDATPEGLAVKGSLGLGMVKVSANGGYLWLQERSAAEDVMMIGGQAAVDLQFIPEVALKLGVGQYSCQNVKGSDVIDWEGKNNSYGNSTVNGTTSGTTVNKAWATEFAPVVTFAQLDVWVLGKPLSLFAQELSNGEADDFEQGHMYGLSYGKAKNPKTWEVGYSYSELEKDATIGFLTDSDRWGGGTDGKGHRYYARYQIIKNLQVGATYMVDDRKISDSSKTTDYDRLQLDLVAGF